MPSTIHSIGGTSSVKMLGMSSQQRNRGSPTCPEERCRGAKDWAAGPAVSRAWEIEGACEIGPVAPPFSANFGSAAPLPVCLAGEPASPQS